MVKKGEIIELPLRDRVERLLFGEWNGFNEGIEWTNEIIKRGERYRELRGGKLLDSKDDDDVTRSVIAKFAKWPTSNSQIGPDQMDRNFLATGTSWSHFNNSDYFFFSFVKNKSASFYIALNSIPWWY